MVNLEWYRSFVAIYQAGTVTAAAQRRFLTQPTLSQHIAALEQALKTSLFTRSARRMEPTEAAQKLYPKVVASIERLEAIAYSPLEEADLPWVRLASPLTYFYEKLLNPSLLTHLGKFRLEVSLGETRDLIEKLKDNEVDMVIATQRTSLPRIHYVPLLKEHFVLVMPKSLPLAVSATNDLEKMDAWLSRQDWISYDTQMPIIRRYWQTVFNKRPDFGPRMVIPDLHSILRCIELGQGLSILPDYLVGAAEAGRNVHIPWRPPVEISNVLYVACQQERMKEPLISMTINALKAHLVD